MKQYLYFLVLIFALPTFSGLSQNNYKTTNIDGLPPDSMRSVFRFANFEEKVSDDEKLAILHRLVSSKYFDAYIKTSESYDFENYHIVDVNGDRFLDVFYDGREPNGIETNNLAIFLNDGDSLRLKVKLNGDILSLKFKNKKLQKLQIMKSPCCNNHIFYIETYEKSTTDSCFIPYVSSHEDYRYTYGEVNSSDYCFALTRAFRYLRGTEFPADIYVKDTMHTNKETYVERLIQMGANALDRVIPLHSEFYVISDTLVTDKKYFFGYVKSEIQNSKRHEKAEVFDYGWIKSSCLE